jgi:L-2-hydroxyglutarate oxidase LhgO
MGEYTLPCSTGMKGYQAWMCTLYAMHAAYQAKHVLFPCPHPVYGKGVLVQSTLWGNLILGPTARDAVLRAGVRAPQPEPQPQPEPKPQPQS